MKLEGEFVDGEAEGKGIAIFNTDDIYSGYFTKSKFHGYGHYKYSNGLEVILIVNI